MAGAPRRPAFLVDSLRPSAPVLDRVAWRDLPPIGISSSPLPTVLADSSVRLSGVYGDSLQDSVGRPPEANDSRVRSEGADPLLRQPDYARRSEGFVTVYILGGGPAG